MILLLSLSILLFSIWLATKITNWIDHYEEQENKKFARDLYKIENENVDDTACYSAWDFVSDEDKECLKLLCGYDVLPSRRWVTKDAAIADADDIINELNHIKRIFSDESN